MGRWRLQADKFLNFYIPIPPYDEQKKIADYITDKVNHIEVEIDKRNKLIKKYQEYKNPHLRSCHRQKGGVAHV